MSAAINILADSGQEPSNSEPFLPQHPTSKKSSTMLARKLSRWAKICAFILVLTFVLIIISALAANKPVLPVTTSSFLSASESYSSGLEYIFIDSSNSKYMTFTDSSTSSEYLSISFPHEFKAIRTDPLNKNCAFSAYASIVETSGDDVVDHLHQNKQICYEFDNQIKVSVYKTDVYKGMECHVVHWYSPLPSASLENCVEMNNDNWYGGGLLSVHRWPLNRAKVAMQPFITKKFNSFNSTQTGAHFTSFIEPYFVSSKGTAILLDDKAPLFLSINDDLRKTKEKICFKSSFEKPFDLNSSEKEIHLNYTVCKDNSARAIHKQLLQLRALNHPKRSPSLVTLQKSVWSTRGLNISNENQLISLINDIKRSGLNISQLFVDGNYFKSMGNFHFNEKKFPHSAQIAMELDEMLPEKTLKLGIEVQPYIPQTLMDKNFSFNKPSSNSETALLNVFNTEACEWYSSQLKSIKTEVHINSFRFSGGDAAMFINSDHINPFNKNEIYSLNLLTTKYSDIASHFQDSSFVGSGYKSQHYGMIADIGPFLSTWDHRKGLKSIIPSVITSGLIGFPFVSAGPVGGIHPDSSHPYIRPSENLYLRWLQLSIFFPVIELTIGPWEYGAEFAKHSKDLFEYRQNTLWTQYLSTAVREAAEMGTPIIRPLWWISPDDKTAQFIDCEFLVTNSLLVAPILNEYAMSRSVYLPDGHWWHDILHGKFYKGGQWLHDFPVNKYEVATFVAKAPDTKI